MRSGRTALVALLMMLSACSATKLAEPATVANPTVAPTARPQAPGQPAQTTVKTVTLHPLDDPKSALAKRSVYFEFDSFLVRDADRPLIEAHARYLASSRSARVRVEGNADERGGREYNLALGQRRAESVVKSLALLGAPAAEIEATSFGKEKPADPGHDETAWSKNRRADFNYLKR